MSIKHLLDDRLGLIWIDVPDLELASKRANQKVILVDLVKASWFLLVVNLRLDAFATSLDVNIADKYLRVFETRNRQNCRRSLKESLGMKLNHSITDAWYRSSNKYRCHWRLSFLSLIILNFFLMNAWFGSWCLRA